ncbi:hypothetical protein AB2L57_09400 [Microbacterium sp. HA-8]|uniref:hypothetical protein n=1 Tax=Microbacterium sp. HA-8 TaxID=3234200 RepID=UPI0038F7BC46
MSDEYKGHSAWYLGAIPSEGVWHRQDFRPHNPRYVESHEERGRLVALAASGDLIHAEYEVFAAVTTNDPGPAECWTSAAKASELRWIPMEDSDLTMLDRPNLGSYRDARRLPGHHEIVRMELRSDYRVTVHARGVGLSKALNQLFLASGGGVP